MLRWLPIYLATFTVLLHASLDNPDDTSYQDYETSDDQTDNHETVNNDKILLGKVDGWPIVMAVVSSADHENLRSIIRSTWGTIARHPDVRLAFAVGQSPSGLVRSQVQAEASDMGDLWVGDFVDTYRNLTLKSIMILETALDRHPDSEVLVKIDDDCFLNPHALIDFVNQVGSGWNQSVIYGMEIPENEVVRDEASDHYVSYEEHESDYYSPYMSGPTYIMSMAAAAALRPCLTQQGPGRNPFPVEDVYVTGICADEAGVPRVSRQLWGDENDLDWAVSIHNVYPRDNFYYWRQLYDNRMIQA